MNKSDFIALVSKGIMDVPEYNVLNFNTIEIGSPIYEEAVDTAVRLYNTLPPATAFIIDTLVSDGDIQTVLDLAIAQALFITAMKHLRNQVLQQSVIVQENDKYSQYIATYRDYKNEALMRAREYKQNSALLSLSLVLRGRFGVQYE